MTQKQEAFSEEMKDRYGDMIEIDAERGYTDVGCFAYGDVSREATSMSLNKDQLDHFIHLLQKAREVME